MEADPAESAAVAVEPPDLADDDDARASLLRGLDDRGDVTKSADDRALVDGGAATGNRDRSARISLGPEKLCCDLDDLVSTLEEHVSDPWVDELSPHEFGVIGINDANLAGATTGEPEAGVGRDTGDVADARGHLEDDLGLAQGAGLVQQRAVDDGITCDESDSALAFLGGIDDELRALDVLERKTARVHGDDDLSIW